MVKVFVFILMMPKDRVTNIPGRMVFNNSSLRSFKISAGEVFCFIKCFRCVWHMAITIDAGMPLPETSAIATPIESASISKTS